MTHPMDRYGTIAFDVSLMRQQIGFGRLAWDEELQRWYISPRGNELVLALWLPLVPLAYRADAERIATEAAASFAGKRFSGDVSIVAFIGEFMARFLREVDYRAPVESE